jgi:hypothetical protein
VEESQRSGVIENSVELCQVGIEPVQVCTEELYVEFRRNRVIEYFVRRSSARSASRRRMPGG